MDKAKKDVPDFFSRTVTIGDSTPSNSKFMKSKKSTEDDILDKYLKSIK